MPRILAVANQKGGVGKTTTAINLGTALAAVGETVLIVDLDPQGNASTGLGIDRKDRDRSTFDVLVGESEMRETIRETAVPGLHIAPSTMDLSGLELSLATVKDRAFRLRDALGKLSGPSRGADGKLKVFAFLVNTRNARYSQLTTRRYLDRLVATIVGCY